MYNKPVLLICFVFVLGLAGSASGSLVAHWRLDKVAVGPLLTTPATATIAPSVVIRSG
ncbi:MAG: hypothetical protein ACYS32_15200 [Planctomycetota bacterium]|jgi:hypothetical protein